METRSRTRWGVGCREVGRKGPKLSETNFVKLGVWGGTESLNDLNFRIH